MAIEILVGDVRERMADIADASIQTVITSPPYFGLRDYGVAGQIGLEDSLNAYIDTMVAVFRDVRRVLRDDGTVWLNIGDSYSASGTTGGTGSYDGADHRTARMFKKTRRTDAGRNTPGGRGGSIRDSGGSAGYYVDATVPAKNLLMVPARLALALQADGWILRSDIIWAKPNPMPESVTDRPTSAHEHIFLLVKSRFYYYDADAVRQPVAGATIDRLAQDVASQNGSDRAYAGGNRGRKMKAKPPTGWQQGATGKRHSTTEHNTPALRSPGLNGAYAPPGQTPHMCAKKNTGKHATEELTAKHQRGHVKPHEGFDNDWDQRTKEEQTMFGANLRNVWTIATHPYRGQHFATFPPEIVKRCILAGTSAVGACPECGAPWRRSTEVSYENPGNRSTNGPRSEAHNHQEFGTAGFAVRLEKRTETTGWSPTCNCDASGPVPCVVFDPFGGAMTTMLVADRLGRDGIAIELNPDYAEIGRKRLRDDAPLFVAVDVNEREPDGHDEVRKARQAGFEFTASELEPPA